MKIELLDLVRGEGCTAEDYMFLFGLTCTLNAKSIAEVGTNRGAGCIIMAYAMKLFNKPYHIHTCDISENYVNIAREEIKKHGLEEYITVYLGTVDKLPKIHYDLAFIDGNHTYEATQYDFDVLKRLSDYIVFHDIQSCEGKEQCFNGVQGEKIKLINRPSGNIITNDGLTPILSYQGLGLWRKV